MLSAKFLALGLALFGSSFVTVAFAQPTDTYAGSDVVARELESFSANLVARQEFLGKRSNEQFEERDLGDDFGIEARSFDEDELVARELEERSFEDDEHFVSEHQERSFDDNDHLVARQVADIDLAGPDPARGYPENSLAEHLASRELHDDLETREELHERSFDEGGELILREVLDERSFEDDEHFVSEHQGRSFDEDDHLVARQVADINLAGPDPARGYPENSLAEHLASREVHDDNHDDLEAREELHERSFDEGGELVLREVLDERSFEDDEHFVSEHQERSFDEDDHLVAREHHERSFDEDELVARELDERSFDEDELVARELDERSFDEDELVARELDERSFDEDELVTREFRQDFEE